MSESANANSDPGTPSAQQHAADLAEYIEKGKELAQSVGNRGPVRFNEQGKLHQDILDAYWEHGFYVFEGVIGAQELEELRSEINYMLDHAPTGKGSLLDAKGRPAYGQQFAHTPYSFVKPLSDPWGGTQLLGGRHPLKMREPVPEADSPAEVVHLIGGMCQTMESGLRLYGHPALLTIAEGINGADFVPFNDATFVKLPGLGGSVSWHQDGVTHWDSADWDMGIHGFNFQVQLYRTTPANSLWVVPGTHKLGRIDIKERVRQNGGSEQIPGAIPLCCEAGDVTIVNRQMLHGSFANTSPDIRISMTFGFHRRLSVVGARGALVQNSDEVYDEQRVFERSSVIAVAIDARAAHYPEEQRYHYLPFEDLVDDFRFNDETFQKVVVDYNLKDLAI
jgi:hypothetical protein